MAVTRYSLLGIRYSALDSPYSGFFAWRVMSSGCRSSNCCSTTVQLDRCLTTKTSTFTRKDLSSETWNVVRTWNYFHKDTLGKQMVRSADSIPSNIAEGYGRYTFKERIRFCHVARGSAFEYRTQLRIAYGRGLMDDTVYAALAELATRLAQLLNGFIRHLRRQLHQQRHNKQQHDLSVQEPNTEYRVPKQKGADRSPPLPFRFVRCCLLK